MNHDNLYSMIQKLNEAAAVKMGVPVDRKFSDRELAPHIQELKAAEADVQNLQRSEQ